MNVIVEEQKEKVTKLLIKYNINTLTELFTTKLKNSIKI